MATNNVSLVEPLELWESNPYANGKIIVLPDGQLILERNIPEFVKSPGDRYYTVIQGETIWVIASEAYGDSKYWHIIADANGIDSPFELQSGQSLLIPDFSTFQLLSE